MGQLEQNICQTKLWRFFLDSNEIIEILYFWSCFKMRKGNGLLMIEICGLRKKECRTGRGPD